ncbi:retrovirus-related pol polyprotein from transposon TNT 1-94 [Tanacetum coccineum]
MGALATIQESNKCTEETKAKADVFLHQHIDEMLEFEYSNHSISKANAVNNNDNRNSKNKRGRGNPRGHGRGRGHYGHNRFPNQNYSYHRGRNNGRGRGQRNYTYYALKVNNFNQKNNEVGTSQNTEGTCFRCGSANHWSKACRTPSHLCELYQAYRKGKEKEVNHVDQFDNTNTELVAADFFDDLEL